MNKNLKLGLIIILSFILILSATGFAIKNLVQNTSVYIKSSNSKEFSEADAISKIIKEHPDFPANPTDTNWDMAKYKGKPRTFVKFKCRLGSYIGKSISDVWLACRYRYLVTCVILHTIL